MTKAEVDAIVGDRDYVDVGFQCGAPFAIPMPRNRNWRVPRFWVCVDQDGRVIDMIAEDELPGAR